MMEQVHGHAWHGKRRRAVVMFVANLIKPLCITLIRSSKPCIPLCLSHSSFPSRTGNTSTLRIMANTPTLNNKANLSQYLLIKLNSSRTAQHAWDQHMGLKHEQQVNSKSSSTALASQQSWSSTMCINTPCDAPHHSCVQRCKPRGHFTIGFYPSSSNAPHPPTHPLTPPMCSFSQLSFPL